MQVGGADETGKFVLTKLLHTSGTSFESKVYLIDQIPDKKNKTVWPLDMQQMGSAITYAKRFGFNDQEIAATSDSRVDDLLRRAYLYDELQAKKPSVTKKVKKAPKMIKAGKPKGKVNVSDQNRKKAFDKLAKSGRKEDAISYLLTK